MLNRWSEMLDVTILLSFWFLCLMSTYHLNECFQNQLSPPIGQSLGHCFHLMAGFLHHQSLISEDLVCLD